MLSYGLKEDESVYVGNVVVDPRQRGRGLGRTIVDHMVRQAFEQYDLPLVKIAVFSNNVGALLLYGSYGFRPFSMKEERDYRGQRVVNLFLRLRRSEHEGA